MTPPVLDLDDPRCQRVSVAGGKAADLSRARSVGLPALAGAVVPTSAAASSLRAGAEALAHRGSGAARLAAMAEPLADSLAAQLRDAVRALGGDVIVRSSADVEGAGEWAGAFSTFSDIGADEVGTAVRGCWASAFGVEAVERADLCGRVPSDLSVAVLVQPRIEPRVAGLARVRGDTVEIDAVVGSPAALMAGWAEGQRVTVDGFGDVVAPTEALLCDDEWREVAALARRAHERLDHPIVEWAWTEMALVLLQSLAGSASVAPIVSSVTHRLPELDQPLADRVARLALAFPGGICDDLVFPWALGLDDPSLLLRLAPCPQAAPLDLEKARSAAEALARQVWSDRTGDVMQRCHTLLHQLRSDRPGEALRALGTLGSPVLAAGRALLRQMLSAGQQAVVASFLRRADAVFGCEVADLAEERAIAPRQSWAGARRWEPFLVSVAQTRGRTVTGIPGSPGVGAGGARVVLQPQLAPRRRRPREVVVAPLPVPGLSPMLWDAAGLVTVGGSAGAHLIEVARSLGVPAVVGCAELGPVAELDGTLLAVDGDAGTVSRHHL